MKYVLAGLVLIPALCSAKELKEGPRLYMYNIGKSELSSVYPMAINESGQIAGYTFGSGAFHAFITVGSGREIREISGLGRDSYGYSINSSGQVAGASITGGNYSPFITQANGQNAKLLTVPVAEMIFAAAQGINDAGTATGYYTYFLNGEFISSSFIASMSDTQVQTIEGLGGRKTFATAINNAGQIAGTATLEGGDIGHVFIRDPITESNVDLGNPIGRTISVMAISSDGRPAGEIGISEGVTQPFSFSNRQQSIVVRPTLGGTRGAAYAVSPTGKIAGSSTPGDSQQLQKAFVAGAKGRLYDLNQFVVNRPSKVTLTKVTGVNSKGQMSVWADNGHGYIVCPKKACR